MPPHDIKLVNLIHQNRSGSTFLASLLDNFDDIAVSVETSMLRHIVELNKTKLRNIDKLTSVLRNKDRGYSRIVKDELAFKKNFSELKIIDHTEVARCILSSYFDHDKPAKCWVVKYGCRSGYVKKIAEKIPKIKFIHIVRDGRAVLSSRLSTKRVYADGYMAEDPLKPALEWRAWIKFMASFIKKNPERVFELRYEDLIRNPAKKLEELRRFLGLESSERHNQTDCTNWTRYKDKIPETERSLHPNVSRKPILENIDKWKTNLSKDYILLFEIVAGKYLKSRGYDCLYYHGKISQLFSSKLQKTLCMSIAKIGKRGIYKIFRKFKSSKQHLQNS